MGLSALVCPPRSGTLLKEVEPGQMELFQVDPVQATIGHRPDRPNIPMSIVSRHFGDYDMGGHGEAKHTAIFGQNGSGKTIAALTLTALQLAANPQMGALIPDTAGDLTKEDGHSKGDFQFNFHELMRRAGRVVHVYDISDIRLNSITTFRGLMRGFLKDSLNTRGENAEQAAEYVATELFDKTVDIAKAQPEAVLEILPEAIASAFAKNSRKTKVDDFQEKIANPRQRSRMIKSYGSRVAQFFEGKYSLEDIIEQSMCKGAIVMIRMAGMNESDQTMVMGDVFHQLKKTAQERFRQTHQTFNGLVVLDEGPRWVPEGRNTDDDIAETIVDAFNTTRKLGIGWTIISQRITGISKNVVSQCHTKLVGKGLGIGADRMHMQSFFGDDGLSTYDQLALRGGYFWLGTGDLINYGQGSQYFAFDMFGGNSTEKLMEANPKIWS
jgi:DNA helicase HerA-like ATPase